MFLYEITLWSRTANSGKHLINENSGLITIGVSNNLWEVRRQGFNGINAKQINYPNELCNITCMLDCNSEKKRTWLKTYRVSDSLKSHLVGQGRLTSYLIGQGRFDVLSYWSRTLWCLILVSSKRKESRTLWSLILLVKDAWRLILLVKDALTSYLTDQERFDVLS